MISICTAGGCPLPFFTQSLCVWTFASSAGMRNYRNYDTACQCVRSARFYSFEAFGSNPWLHGELIIRNAGFYVRDSWATILEKKIRLLYPFWWYRDLTFCHWNRVCRFRFIVGLCLWEYRFKLSLWLPFLRLLRFTHLGRFAADMQE